MNKHSLMYPDNGTGAAAGGGAAGGAAASAPPGQQQQAGQQQQQGGQDQGPFADAGAARTYLSEFVHDPEFLKAVPDDKVLPWAKHHKSRTDEFGKSFPGSWRELIAGQDAEKLKTLERFATPTALFDSYGALRQKLSSGELRQVVPFPEKGTPQEQAAWRASNNVPEKPEDYKFAFDPKVQLTDDDKAVLQSLQKSAHAKNLSNASAQAAADWYVAEKQARVEARLDKDDQFRTESEDALRAHFGNDFRPAMNRMAALLDQAPNGMREMLSKARLADGTLLGDHPEWVKWFVDISHQLVPAGVVLPGAGGDIGKSVEDEITTIEKVMKENRSAYNKDEKMQQRYRDLLDARDKIAGRKKAA